MTLLLIEGAIDALKTYLSANMAAKLTSLNTEYGDFTLADIQNWYVAELSAIPEYPAIVLLGDRTSVEAEGGGWMESSHTITIAAIATDQNTETLRRRLYRYMRAIVELLIASRPTIGYVINIDALEFSPMYGRAETFLSDARVVIRAKKYETT